MSDVPSLDVFRSSGVSKPGGWTDFVKSMGPNIPVDVSSKVPMVGSSESNMLRQTAKRMGRKVALRTVEGRVWACWLVDDE